MIENIESLKDVIKTNHKELISLKNLTRFEYNPKDHQKSSKFVMTLINRFYVNLKLVNAFKKWHKAIINENLEEIQKAVFIVQDDIYNIKLLNFGQILKNRYNKTLKLTISGLMKKISRKNDVKNFTSKVLSVENYYNNKLLKTYRGVYLLHRMKILRNIFIMKFKPKIDNFFCNKISNYFYLWKAVCERLNLSPDVYLRHILKLISIFDHIIYLRKISFMIRLKILANKKTNNKQQVKNNLFDVTNFIIY